MLGLRSKIHFLYGAVTRRLPLYVLLSVESSCNLHCHMCHAANQVNTAALSLAEIRQVAQVLRQLGVSLVVLTGGEPLLRKDLPEIVQALTEQQIEVRLQSNGTLLTPDLLQRLLDAGVSEFSLSLDSLRAEIQDEINGRPGSWLKVMAALELLAEQLPRKGNMTAINTVVSRANLAELPGLVRFVTRLGFYHSLIPLHPAGADFMLRGGEGNLTFGPEDKPEIEQVYRQLAEMKRHGAHIHNSYRFLRESAQFLSDGMVRWQCDSPDLYFAVSADGRLLPCVDRDGRHHLLEQDFVSRFKRGDIRAELKREAAACSGCMYACYSEISYFCRDPQVFTERLQQGWRISRFRREPLTGRLLDLVAQCRQQDPKTLPD